MASLGLLQFEPIFRRYVWGGRRLETLLGKRLGAGDDYAESWEIVDHGADQSIVSGGPLQGLRLRDVVERQGDALLGRHAGLRTFPLLFKFLDAQQRLSLQVHPNDEQAARLRPPDSGKTEAWIVLQADTGSRIYAGFQPGVDRSAFEEALRAGTADRCLHQFEPRVGDCVFLPAGTVHALGGGLVVAEIQQASNTTFRLFDWNRRGADGKPRTLHIQAGLEVTDFESGAVRPAVPQPTERDAVVRLVACEHFVVDRVRIDSSMRIGGDQRFHLLVVLAGRAGLEAERADLPLRRGQTVLLPASLGTVQLQAAEPATFLDIYLP